MNLRRLTFAVCLLGMGMAGPTALGQTTDPLYGFPFGYTLGYQYSFRNRLPAPPYFAIHPPVYYGERHLRPYGESPYASFPLLGSTPEYSPVPAERYAPVPRTVANPYSPPCCASHEDGADRSPSVSLAAAQAPRARLIVNPFAHEQVASKE
jgi:hypothetical protein